MDETCTACGARLYGDAAFCGQCFAKVDRRAPLEAPIVTVTAPPAPVAAPAAPIGAPTTPASPFATPGTPTGELRQAEGAMSYLTDVLGAGGLLGDADRSGPSGPAWSVPGEPDQAGRGAAEAGSSGPAPARPQWWDGQGTPATPALAETVLAPAPPDGPAPWPPLVPLAPPKIDQRAVRTAIGVIGLGLAFQIVMFALGRVGTVEPSTAIRLSLYGTCAFYVLVGAVVVSQAQQVAFRPAWTQGDSTMAGLVGAATGAAVGAGGLLLTRLAAGHVVVDQRIALIVSERSITRIAAAILIAVVAAPLVEELLFRGLVVESMRVRGAGPAIMTGAVLFSVWHLNPSLFVYYLAMGSLLGRLYWRRGLKSSIAGHAAFNGTITLVAIVLALGAHTITNNGVSVQVPGGWHRVTSTTAVPASLDLVLAGPSGSGMFVGHQAIRAGVDVDLDRVAQLIDGGQVPFPGVELAGRSQVTGYAAGPALRVRVRYRGHAGDVVIVKGAAELWTIVLYTGGSGTAEHDLDSILSHLRLPEAATGNP